MKSWRNVPLHPQPLTHFAPSLSAEHGWRILIIKTGKGGKTRPWPLTAGVSAGMQVCLSVLSFVVRRSRDDHANEAHIPSFLCSSSRGWNSFSLRSTLSLSLSVSLHCVCFSTHRGCKGLVLFFPPAQANDDARERRRTNVWGWRAGIVVISDA